MTKLFVTENIDIEASFAMELMRQMAMVAALPDGVDDAGRQKARLMSPSEVVDRACEISELAIAHFRGNGWIYKKVDKE